MKRILRALVAAWVAAGVSAAADEVTPDSGIVAVTVYPGAARVTRRVVVDLPVGEHSVVFRDIVPEIDESSLTVSGRGPEGTRIYGVSLRREHLPRVPDARVRELEEKIRSIDDAITHEQESLAVLEKQRAFLESIRLFAGGQIPKDLVTVMPPVEKLRETMTFLTDGLQANVEAREKGRLRIRDLKDQREVLRRQLDELRQPTHRPLTRSVVVDLKCARAGKVQVDIAYVVTGADWSPVYDARTHLDDGRVTINGYGVVRQNTGEDWTDVRLTLSTARPTLSGRMPEPTPWILRPYQTVRARRNGFLKTMATLALEAKGSDEPEEAASPRIGTVQAGIRRKGISVSYEIVRPATVRSDGTDFKFPITGRTLKADFRYAAFPRAGANAYLTARVVNDGEDQFLPGPLGLFLEGDYVGKSALPLVGAGETFDLSLGLDESVKVERKEISRKMDDVLIGGIPAPTRKVTVRYRLSVQNLKTRPIEMALFDAVPVSQDEKVKVRVTRVSRAPTQKDWRDRKGVWLWELDLAPRAKEEIYYTVTVEYPRKMRVPF